MPLARCHWIAGHGPCPGLVLLKAANDRFRCTVCRAGCTGDGCFRVPGPHHRDREKAQRRRLQYGDLDFPGHVRIDDRCSKSWMDAINGQVVFDGRALESQLDADISRSGPLSDSARGKLSDRICAVSSRMAALTASSVCSQRMKLGRGSSVSGQLILGAFRALQPRCRRRTAANRAAGCPAPSGARG
jgi:hypothetical protein